jgi:hypothetical protein
MSYLLRLWGRLLVLLNRLYLLWVVSDTELKYSWERHTASFLPRLQHYYYTHKSI